MTKSMKRIHKVVIKRMVDTDPDASYLEQEGFEHRLEQYKQGMFDYMGVRADAEIWVPTYAQFNKGASILQSITSGGLWGIESDSDSSYIAEIEQEQLAELREQLHALGFSKRAIAAAFKNVERRAD